MELVDVDDDELVVARTLSGDRNTFSFLGDGPATTRSELAEAAREGGMTLADSWQQPSAAGAGAVGPLPRRRGGDVAR